MEKSNDSNTLDKNPCTCALALPAIENELHVLRSEILQILQQHPEWSGIIFDTLRYGIKGHIIKDNLEKGRCREIECLHEVPAMSRHFICTADKHHITFETKSGIKSLNQEPTKPFELTYSHIFFE